MRVLCLSAWRAVGAASVLLSGALSAMAQTAAVLVVHTLGLEAEGKLVYFMSVDNARFRRPVFPGDRLDVYVAKQRHRGNVWKFEGQAKVGDNLMAEAVFAAMILNE